MRRRVCNTTYRYTDAVVTVSELVTTASVRAHSNMPTPPGERLV